MTIDHVSASESWTVATCECGWASHLRRGGQNVHVRQDAEIAAHWRDAAGGAAADPWRTHLIVLEAVQRDGSLPPVFARDRDDLLARGWIAGKRTLTLTDAGQIRLGGLRHRAEREAAAERLCDEAEETADAAAPADDADIPAFLRGGVREPAEDGA